MEKETNLGQIRNELKSSVYYKDIYKNSEDFYDFKFKISTECSDLIFEALRIIDLYIENNALKGSDLYNHKYSYTEEVLTEQLFEPIWYGFVAEEYNIDLFNRMGIEVYTFTDEGKERKFDDDYSIDHMIRLNGRWVGVQSKCETFFYIPTEEKEYYYYKHKKCLRERKKIKNIYYIFYEKSKPHIKYKDMCGAIDGTELDGFLIPYDKIFNINNYAFKGIDYQTLFVTEEEEEEDFDDLPF